MEWSDYHDYFYFKTRGKKPQRFCGKPNKQAWKNFKRSCTHFEVQAIKGHENVSKRNLNLDMVNEFSFLYMIFIFIIFLTNNLFK
jgi:hypothetical protein